MRGLVAERLGHPGGVLIPDETSFVKKGRPRCRGRPGPRRIENSQVGVFLAYASPHGRALVDRRIYLPEQSCCDDAARRKAAGIPSDTAFATKPRLALDMIGAALDTGLPVSWVTRCPRWWEWIATRLIPGHIDRTAALTEDLRRIGAVAEADAHTGQPGQN